MKMILGLVSCLVMTLATEAQADTPVYRASWTATGVDPQVTISAQEGDAFVVFVSTSNQSSTDTYSFDMTDDRSGSWNDLYCGAIWAQSSNKFGRAYAFTRTTLAANTESMTISFDSLGKNAALLAVAIGGMTSWDGTPKINGCGSTTNPNGLTNGNVRMVKSVPYCVDGCSHESIEAGTTPAVPRWFQQQSAFQSTSLTLAVLYNMESTPGVTAPTDWTQRSTVSTTAQGKTIAMNLSSRDSGFSGTTVTWGSTTPTDGTGLVVEVTPSP